MEAPQKKVCWMGTTKRLIEDLELAYGFDFNFQTMHLICFRFEYIMVKNVKGGIQAECYTGESEHLFYNFLRPLTSLDERLYALASEKVVRCLATFVGSFKLIEVYIEHGVTVVDFYNRPPPQFRVTTIEEITDEPSSIALIEHRSEKMLLLTWHDSSEPTKEPIFDSVTPMSLPQHDSITPCKDSACESVTPMCMPHLTASQVIEGVMRQLSFEKTKLDREAGFGDVAESGIKSSGLSHDESLVSMTYVGRTQEPIMEESIDNNYKSLSEIELDHEIVDRFVVVVVKVGCRKMIGEIDDGLVGEVEKLGWWFEQDIDDEGGRMKDEDDEDGGENWVIK
nr:hypothetical protein [Tanacetum cinerariifolium]